MGWMYGRMVAEKNCLDGCPAGWEIVDESPKAYVGDIVLKWGFPS